MCGIPWMSGASAPRKASSMSTSFSPSGRIATAANWYCGIQRRKDFHELQIILATASRSRFSLAEQPSRLRNQLRHFERFYQVGYVVFLQKSPLIALLHAIRERK
jgi:hypothetical protein